jgi:multicomponent Na+:H+ antiporter subunit D
MNSNIIILPIVIPIVFALLIIFISKNNLAKFIGFISFLLSSYFSFKINYFFLNCNNKSYYIDYIIPNLSQSISIALKINFFNSSISFLINLSGLIIFLYLIGAKKDSINYTEIFLILIFISGMNGILFSNDIFNIFVFLELSSISSYAMVINLENLKSVKVSFFYLIFGSLSASFYLIGIIFLYNQFGSLNIDLIINSYKKFNNAGNIPANVLFGSFFIITGFLVKFGSFPFYKYLIDVYQKSSSFITAIFASISSKINFYLIFISCFFILNITYFEKSIHIIKIISYIGIFSALYFSLYANFISTKNIKKILVYSSFSEMSYILSLFIFYNNDLNNNEIEKLIINFFVNHSFCKIGLILLFESFFSQKFIKKEIDIYRINNMQTYSLEKYLFNNWQNKAINFCFLFLILNSIGAPPFLGFKVKFSLALKFFETQNYFFLTCFLIIILFSVLYNIKIFFEYFENKNIKYANEMNDQKISINSFKIINFYNLFVSLSFCIFFLVINLFIL